MKAEQTTELRLTITQPDLAIMLLEYNDYPKHTKLSTFNILPTSEGDIVLKGIVNPHDDGQPTVVTKAGV